MNTRLLICGLVILLVANILMLFVTPSQLSPSREGFANYYLQNGAGAGAGGPRGRSGTRSGDLAVTLNLNGC